MAITLGPEFLNSSGATDPEFLEATLPTITANGVVLVAFVYNTALTAGFTTLYDGGDAVTAGWTIVQTNLKITTNNTSSAIVLAKTVTTADSGKVLRTQWTTPTTARSAFIGRVYYGADAVNISGWTAESGTGGTNHTPPAVTSTEAGWVVNILGYRQSSFTGSWTPPAGRTMRSTLIQGASGTNVVGLADSNGNVSAGTITTGVFVSPVSTTSGHMFTIVLEEAPVGPPPAGTVTHSWVGSPTSDGITIASKVSAATSVRLAISTSPSMTSPTYVSAQVPNSRNYVKHVATGLTANTQYYYQLADTPSGGSEELIGNVGKFKTLPTAGSTGTFTVAFGACSLTNAADGVALDDIRTWNPNFMVHMGDFHYGGPNTTVVDTHVGLWESQIQGADGMKELVRDVPMFYTRSDHDTTNVDNGDSNTSNNQASIDGYKAVVPHAPLVDANNPTQSLHQSWVVGRIRFIMVDIRNMNRTAGLTADSSSKTMLGSAQKAWLKTELSQPEPLKVIISDSAWMGAASTSNGEDKWWSYATERQELIDYINTNLINVLFVHGDSHLIGVASKTKNTWGNFPVWCAAPLNNVGGGRNPSTFDSFFSNSTGDCRQYMRVTFTDNGSTITASASGWDAAAGVQRVSATEEWNANGNTVQRYWNGTSWVPRIRRRRIAGEWV